MIDTLAAPAQLSRGRLVTVAASRFVLNAMFRVAYPLVPFLALRFGVTEALATWVVTIQVLFGLLSPLGGWLGDRVGYRTMMLIGLSLALLGALGATMATTLWMLLMAYAASGLGIAAYQPAMQAYIAALTTYGERGRAVGLVELSWALVGIVAIPPLMWLVDVQNTTAGLFAIISVGLVCAMLATLLVLPSEPASAHGVHQRAGYLETVLGNRSVLGLIVFVFLGLAGVEMLVIAQAPWVTARFDASLTDLGLAAFVFGIGELGGSSASAVFTDRLGKRRAATLGFTMAALIYLALPLVSVSWLSYLICYMLFALCVEFAIVASLTLASTVSVVGRGTVMALTVTAIQLGRVISSSVGVALLHATSIYGNALLAAVLTITGVIVARRFVQERERHVAGEGA